MEKGLLNRSDRCPCCWDAATNAACGSADCMPFSFSSGGVATALDGSYSTCRSYAASLPSWAQPTYTAKGRGGTPYVYATEAQTANGCTFYFLQYCRENESGTNGRSWQVEYFCSGDDGATVAHLETEILDWNCTCAGARYAFGFSGAVADDYGCCLASSCGTVVVPCSDDPISKCLTVSIGGCLNVDVPVVYDESSPIGGTTYWWKASVANPVGPTRPCLNVGVLCQGGVFKLGVGCRFEPCDPVLAYQNVHTLSGTTSPFSMTTTFPGSDTPFSVPEYCCDTSASDTPVAVTPT